MQFFLQAKLLGIEGFVEAASDAGDCAGRSLYLSLLMEVLPRAMVERLGLAKELVGLSGGGQFLAVLPGESLEPAHEFLAAATLRLSALSGGVLRLIWSATENLGEWGIVRKRLFEPLEQMQKAPGFAAEVGEPETHDWAALFFRPAVAAKTAGYDPDSPLLVVLDGGTPRWPLGTEQGPGTIHVARHYARAVDGETPAGEDEVAARAHGRKLWGVLRGDVDQFLPRLRRAQTIEEHIQLTVFLQQFFAGELQVACLLGESWQKLTVLSTGGDDFAVFGAWDALIPLAREVQRLFHKSAEEFLKDLPGPEGKTLSMAVTLAEPGARMGQVFAQAGRELEAAKSAGKDSIALLGRVVDSKQLGEASDLKDGMTRLTDQFHCSPEFLGQLSGYYRETTVLRVNRTKADRFDRPWRFYRRVSRVLDGPERNREYQKARAAMLGEFIGKNQAHVKLRPSGRVALEWARLLQEAE